MSKRNRIISLEKYSSCHIFVKMYKDKCANIYHRKWWETIWNGKSIESTCKVCYVYGIDRFNGLLYYSAILWNGETNVVLCYLANILWLYKLCVTK